MISFADTQKKENLFKKLKTIGEELARLNQLKSTLEKSKQNILKKHLRAVVEDSYYEISDFKSAFLRIYKMDSQCTDDLYILLEIKTKTQEEIAILRE